MKKYNGVIAVIAIIYTVCYIIAVITMIILTALKYLYWVSFLVSFVSCTVELILVWALNSALARIEVLETLLNKKGLIVKSEIDEETVGYSEEPDENIIFCQNCGYQLFPEDKICPVCKTKVKIVKTKNLSLDDEQ